MFNTKLLGLFSRLSINSAVIPSRNVSISAPMFLNVTNVLYAEPLKKKKRMDPAILKAREERRRKKLEKSIKRLEKHAQQLKPIAELVVTTKMKDEMQMRKREMPVLSVEVLEARAVLFKDWTRHKTKEHKEMLRLIETYISKQDKALDALKAMSETRYQEAIQIDPEFLPYTAKGPVHTPPIEKFDAPDGDYTDITKKYDGE